MDMAGSIKVGDIFLDMRNKDGCIMVLPFTKETGKGNIRCIKGYFGDNTDISITSDEENYVLWSSIYDRDNYDTSYVPPMSCSKVISFSYSKNNIYTIPKKNFEEDIKMRLAIHLYPIGVDKVEQFLENKKAYMEKQFPFEKGTVIKYDFRDHIIHFVTFPDPRGFDSYVRAVQYCIANNENIRKYFNNNNAYFARVNTKDHGTLEIIVCDFNTETFKSLGKYFCETQIKHGLMKVIGTLNSDDYEMLLKATDHSKHKEEE